MIPRRSPVLAAAIRLASPFALIVGAYLLFAGHNRPGGGFAAGLVVGAVVALRALVGFARPAHPITLLAGGALLVAVVSLLPLFGGEALLDQAVVSTEVPLLGKVKSGSALPFDIGVAAVVVGVIVALLEGLADPGTVGEEPSR